MFKYKLLELYKDEGVTQKQLRDALNKTYYEELKKVGYEKRCKFIPPKVVRRFFELFGAPISKNEFEFYN